MTIYRNSYLVVLLILFFLYNDISCSGAGQKAIYQKAITKTGSITLPDCKPAKGLTRAKTSTWLHPEIAEGQDLLVESIMLFDWETLIIKEVIDLKVKMTANMKINGEPIAKEYKALNFSCNIQKDGRIENIVHTDRDLAHVISQPKLEELTEVVRMIIPHFPVETFKSDDVVSVSIENLSEFISGLDEFPNKSIYKGISTYNGRAVIVIENNDKIKKGRITGHQTGYSLYDFNSRYIVASEGQVKVNYDKTNVLRITIKISTIMQEK